MIRKSLLPATVPLLLAALPVVAHHSFAMFDADRTTMLEGSVKKFQWTNPHSWVYVTVVDAEGKSVDWVVELGSPGQLARQGWTPETLTPGMKLKVQMHPLRSGMPGGQFVSATLPDGKPLMDTRVQGEGGGATDRAAGQ